MPATKQRVQSKLPTRFEDLVRLMPPRAISNADDYDATLEMVDRLMGIRKLAKGQAAYFETLVQLVEAYEAARFPIDVTRIRGLDSLKHLLRENSMNASDLARLLGIHASMGSKILNGERSLTVDHVKTLSTRFKVSPSLFID